MLHWTLGGSTSTYTLLCASAIIVNIRVSPVCVELVTFLKGCRMKLLLRSVLDFHGGPFAVAALFFQKN